MSPTLKQTKKGNFFPNRVNIDKSIDSENSQGRTQPSSKYFKNNLISNSKTFQLLSHNDVHVPSLQQVFQTFSFSDYNNNTRKLLIDNKSQIDSIEKSESINFLKELEIRMKDELSKYEINKKTLQYQKLMILRARFKFFKIQKKYVI